MSTTARPNFDVRVKFKERPTPRVSIHDANGNPMGRIDVHEDSTITFVPSPGSDPFYFVGFYAQTSEFEDCPAPGSAPPNPPTFPTVTLSPPNQPTLMVVDDSNTGPRGATKYHYAVQIRTTDDTPTYHWSDPEIVNHVDSPLRPDRPPA